MSYWIKRFELSDTFSDVLFNHLEKILSIDRGDMELKIEYTIASGMQPEIEHKKESEVMTNKIDENEIDLQWPKINITEIVEA